MTPPGALTAQLFSTKYHDSNSIFNRQQKGSYKVSNTY